MIIKKVKNNYICINKHIYNKSDKIKIFLDKYLDFIFEKISEPIILVLWWDWTMLRAIRKYYKKNIAFLWINFGNIGFLLNEKKHIKNLSKYKIIKYPLLEVNYKLDNKIFSWICFNEVNINVSDWKVLNLKVNIWKEELKLRWDWVLVVTPAWSTAYNKSLYWPILEHSIESFIITPKAEINHKKPIIFKNNKKVKIKTFNRFNPFKIFLDSNILWKKITKEEVEINIFKSKYKVSFIILDN